MNAPGFDLAIITLDFPPQSGGVQNFLYETARRMGKKAKVTVLTSAPGHLPEEEPFSCRRLASSSPLHFGRQLRRLRPDRVLVGHAHPRLLLAAALGRHGRYALLTHGNDFLAGQRAWHRPLFNRLIARAYPLLTNSQANAARLGQLGMPPPTVIYPGADHNRFTPPRQRPAPLTLLTVSRLVPRKGIDTVITCLPSLRDKFSGLRYQIVGTGSDADRLAVLAKSHGVAEAVRFLGHVSDAALPELYRRAHVFVMPAREIETAGSVEGFGIVYLEASACGLPVVAGHSGGAVEAVRHEETGFLVPPDDAAALTKILHKLLADEDLRRRLGQNGRAWIESKMNWDRAAQEMAHALRLL